jgi:dienelactone hydrolase
MRLQNSSTLQELASWGYVVVAIDHTGAAAVTVFPDGEASFYDETTFGIPAGEDERADQIDKQMFPVWVADQRFVYDTIEAWQEHDPLFAQKLDLTKIGSFGHSFGGATSLEVCRVDARCQAAVDMDGGLYGEMTRQAPVRPMMLMTSSQVDGVAEAVARWEALFARATVPSYWLELPNSSHISFTISELLSPLLAPEGFSPRAGLATVDRYLRAFFDRYLLGEETLPLGPSPETKDVIWHDVR